MSVPEMGGREVLEALASLPDETAGALATVVRTTGSTPRKAGTRMVILTAEERLIGTVGGGCGESEVITAAAEVVRTGVPRLLQVELTEDITTWSPAVCGGVMEVLIEPLER